MTRSLRSAVAALCLLGIRVVNGDDVNKFTYPTEEGLKWNYRDTIITAYEGNISAPVMYTFCGDSKGNVEQERYDHVNGPNTTAAIILDFVVDKPITSCWFNIRFDKPDSAVGANSVNFQYNSTEGERKTFSLAPTSTSTSSSPTSTSTQSGVSTTNPAISATSTTNPSASAAPSHTPGLSTGASAGVGVGVGLVGVAIGAGLVAFIYRRRKKRGVADDGSEKGGAGGGPGVASTPPELMGSSQYPPPSAGAPPSTMASTDPTKAGYYAQVPNSEIHEAPAFQDGVVKAELGAPYVPYHDAAAGAQQQKYRDTPSIAPTQEMEAISVVHEMP
ncbi:hypothetical protein F5Y02DRAFT_405755 [Annulohypoxylon stygium]|nr:hypothetical protein F5Y02DRAFT_405755 [Annulohypoxylon stygium]